MSRRLRPTLIAAALALVAVLLTACEAPRPDVTFYGNRDAVSTGPTLWCTINEQATAINCGQGADVAAAPRLALRPGQPVQINVPSAIGNTPWQVYFQYTDAAGTTGQGRSDLLTGKLAYTLFPFEPTDQLTRVEVQAGLTFVPGQSNGVDVAATRTWVLLVDALPQVTNPAG